MIKYDLVIATDALIGDYVLWHDTVIAYKKKYKNRRVLLICDDRLIELAELDDFYTDIIGFNRKQFNSSFFYVAAFVRKIRKYKADVLIYPSTTHHYIGEIMACFFRAKERISFKSDEPDQFTWKSLITSFIDKRYTKLYDNHGEINEIKVLESFTKDLITPEYKYGSYAMPVKKYDFGITKQYALISLSSSISSKIWNVEKFAEIIDKIPNEYSIVLSGVGMEDVERSKTIFNLVKDKSRLIDMVNKTSVISLLSLIAASSFVIGNDSAAVHMAAATHVPSICVFHGAHFNRFLPYPSDMSDTFYSPRAVYYKMDCFGCCYICDKPKSNGALWCLDQVTVDMVSKVLNKLLKELEVKNEKYR